MIEGQDKLVVAQLDAGYLDPLRSVDQGRARSVEPGGELETEGETPAGAVEPGAPGAGAQCGFGRFGFGFGDHGFLHGAAAAGEQADQRPGGEHRA